MARPETDLTLSLEQLTGKNVGNPEDAPTPLVEWIYRSWKKPLNSLSDEEVGRLILQRDGFPYVLDLVWPKLRADPLFLGGYYEGDVLFSLIRAEDEIWFGREWYRDELETLFKAAMERPSYERFGFMESLDLPESRGKPN